MPRIFALCSINLKVWYLSQLSPFFFSCTYSRYAMCWGKKNPTIIKETSVKMLTGHLKRQTRSVMSLSMMNFWSMEVLYLGKNFPRAEKRHSEFCDVFRIWSLCAERELEGGASWRNTIARIHWAAYHRNKLFWCICARQGTRLAHIIRLWDNPAFC